MKVEMSLYAARVMFSRTLLYASRDESRPVLCAVQVEARADGTVVAAAADGFRLGVQTHRATVKMPGTVLIHWQFLAESMKTWPTTRRGAGTVILEQIGNQVRLTYRRDDADGPYTPEVTSTANTVEGKYPDYPQLVTAALKDIEPGDRIAFNADFLAEVAKVARLDPESSGLVRFEFSKPSSPGVFIFTGEVGDFCLLIMPMFVVWTDDRAIDRIFADLGITPKRSRRKKPAA